MGVEEHRVEYTKDSNFDFTVVGTDPNCAPNQYYNHLLRKLQQLGYKHSEPAQPASGDAAASAEPENELRQRVGKLRGGFDNRLDSAELDKFAELAKLFTRRRLIERIEKKT